MKLHYRIFLFVILLVWCSGIFFNYIIHINGNLIIAYPVVNKMYALVCHQQHDKLLHFWFGDTLVCSRCTGIYLGLLLLAFVFVFYSFRKIPDIKYLVYLSLPMAADVLFSSLGIYNYSKTIAFATGFLFGSAGFLYLYKGIIILLKDIQVRN